MDRMNLLLVLLFRFSLSIKAIYGYAVFFMRKVSHLSRSVETKMGDVMNFFSGSKIRMLAFYG